MEQQCRIKSWKVKEIGPSYQLPFSYHSFPLRFFYQFFLLFCSFSFPFPIIASLFSPFLASNLSFPLVFPAYVCRFGSQGLSAYLCLCEHLDSLSLDKPTTGEIETYKMREIKMGKDIQLKLNHESVCLRVCLNPLILLTIHKLTTRLRDPV